VKAERDEAPTEAGACPYASSVPWFVVALGSVGYPIHGGANAFGIRFTVTPRCHPDRMEASGSVRYRRGIMRVVTPTSIAEQLSEVRQAAAAFGVDAVTDALERTAQEALAVASTDEERELAGQLLAVARQTRVRRSLRR
jgi:hypothetical protein